MIAFIKGKVHSIALDHIIMDCNNVGYHIYFASAEKIRINEELTIYTYQHVREDEISLFGFLANEEKAFFMKLISVKGVGPKTAMNILGFSNYQNIITAIEENNLAFIKSLPGIGTKSASQIILDLKGKLVTADNNQVASKDYLDALEGLKSLGYKAAELTFLNKMFKENPKSSTDEYLKYGLKLLNDKKRGN